MEEGKGQGAPLHLLWIVQTREWEGPADEAAEAMTGRYGNGARVPWTYEPC